jgi:hypothetical protein
MKALKRFAITHLSVLGFASQAQEAAPQKSDADAMGRELRLRALSIPAKELGIFPTAEFPRTYAVLIDFPIDDNTATIVSLSDGSASLYTTSSFGIIGGGVHEKVRLAAANLVTASDKFFDEAKPTKEYPYPSEGKVRFYLVSFNGVRVLEADLAAIESDQSRFASLFWLGQEVLTQLRLATEKK